MASGCSSSGSDPALVRETFDEKGLRDGSPPRTPEILGAVILSLPIRSYTPNPHCDCTIRADRPAPLAGRTRNLEDIASFSCMRVPSFQPSHATGLEGFMGVVELAGSAEHLNAYG